MTDISFGKLTSMHFYGWKRGLKTGMYYLRSKAAADAIKFTVDQEMLKKSATDQKKKQQPVEDFKFSKPQLPSNQAFTNTNHYGKSEGC